MVVRHRGKKRIDGGHHSRRAGTRRSAHQRFQQRQSGRRRLLPVVHPQRLAQQLGGGLSQARARRAKIYASKPMRRRPASFSKAAGPSACAIASTASCMRCGRRVKSCCRRARCKARNCCSSPASDRASLLRRHGIDVVHDLPGVGQNLQDHLQFRLMYRVSKPITTNDDLRTLAGQARIGLKWLMKGTGPLGIGINQGGLFTRILPGSANARHSISFRNPVRGACRRQAASVVRLHFLGLPVAAGIARQRRDQIGGPDGAAVDAPELSCDRERPSSARSNPSNMRASWRPPKRSSPTSRANTSPAPRCNRTARSSNSRARTARRSFIPTGTCKMGSDRMAVTDASLRVHGIAGSARRRLFDHADAGVGQHACAGGDDRGKSLGHDPARPRGIRSIAA